MILEKLRLLIFTLICSCCVLAIRAQEAVPADGNPDSCSVVFSFKPGSAAFLDHYNSNSKKIPQLGKIIDDNRDDLEEGKMMLSVNGFSNSYNTDSDNKSAAKTRSNHVKSWFITHYGLKEENYRTQNIAGTAGTFSDAVIVKLRDKEYGMLQGMMFPVNPVDSLTGKPAGIRFPDYNNPLLYNNYLTTVPAIRSLAKEPIHPRLRIGTNLLYLAALAPNVTAEYYFPNTPWSVSASFTMPWWKRESKHQFYQIRHFLAEGRYWLNNNNTSLGHFLGWNIHGGIYDLENGREGYYGDLLGTGLTYGYMFRLNKKMSLELTVGAGYIYTDYEKYLPIDGRYVYQSSHKSNYWGITKLGVSLMWNIF